MIIREWKKEQGERKTENAGRRLENGERNKEKVFFNRKM